MVVLLTDEQVIDYKAHESVHALLAETFKESPLDFIFDCAGDDVLYEKSPSYLKPGGKFISIVGGVTQGILPTIKYRLRPVILGGVPRSFSLLGLSPSGLMAKEVAKMFEEGLIKETPIDSEFEMKDVVQVRFSGGLPI